MKQSTARKARWSTILAGSALAAGMLLVPATANAAETSTTTSTTTVSAPAAPSTTSAPASATQSQATPTTLNWDDLTDDERDVSGTHLEIVNNTGQLIAVTQSSGGDANWTWVSPGSSYTLDNMNSTGTDIDNGWIYFSSDQKMISFTANDPTIGYVNIDVSDETHYLSIGETQSSDADGHSYQVTRNKPWDRDVSLSSGVHLFRQSITFTLNS